MAFLLRFHSGALFVSNLCECARANCQISIRVLLLRYLSAILQMLNFFHIFAFFFSSYLIKCYQRIEIEMGFQVGP